MYREEPKFSAANVIAWAAIALIVLAIAFAIGAGIANKNHERNASLCADQGGIYLKTSSGEYDCLGETPITTRTR